MASDVEETLVTNRDPGPKSSTTVRHGERGQNNIEPDTCQRVIRGHHDGPHREHGRFCREHCAFGSEEEKSKHCKEKMSLTAFTIIQKTAGWLEESGDGHEPGEM